MGDIPAEPIDEYEWNANRKLWHLVGCLVMVAIFYSWKDLDGLVLNAAVLLGFVWAEVSAAVAIDIMRFYSPRQNEIVNVKFGVAWLWAREVMVATKLFQNKDLG